MSDDAKRRRLVGAAIAAAVGMVVSLPPTAQLFVLTNHAWQTLLLVPLAGLLGVLIRLSLVRVHVGCGLVTGVTGFFMSWGVGRPGDAFWMIAFAIGWWIGYLPRAAIGAILAIEVGIAWAGIAPWAEELKMLAPGPDDHVAAFVLLLLCGSAGAAIGNWLGSTTRVRSESTSESKSIAQ